MCIQSTAYAYFASARLGISTKETASLLLARVVELHTEWCNKSFCQITTALVESGVCRAISSKLVQQLAAAIAAYPIQKKSYATDWTFYCAVLCYGTIRLEGDDYFDRLIKEYKKLKPRNN